MPGAERPIESGGVWAAWVLLRHTLGDGTSHLDWLIEDVIDEGPGLVSFRLSSAQEWPPRERFEAERIGAHRREYLTYEGPISGGRGFVVRVDSGKAEVVAGVGWMRLRMATVTVRGDAVGGERPRDCAGGIPERWVFDLEN